MGAGRCSRCIALSLIPPALISMMASLALLFPNGETVYLMEKHIPWTITVQVGLWGSGLLILASIFYSLLAIIGSGLCFGISAIGLANGPHCVSNVTFPNNSHVQLWNYPFEKRDVSAVNYLYDSSRWGTCLKPKNIVVWNLIFFSILLAVSSLEALLCSFQIINAFFGSIFGI